MHVRKCFHTCTVDGMTEAERLEEVRISRVAGISRVGELISDDVYERDDVTVAAKDHSNSDVVADWDTTDEGVLNHTEVASQPGVEELSIVSYELLIKLNTGMLAMLPLGLIETG